MPHWNTDRFPDRLDATAFAERRRKLRERLDAPSIDLRQSDPTRHWPEHRQRVGRFLAAGARAAAARPYRNRAQGLPPARRAVSTYYARRGIDLPADQIVLTASTSEAYGWIVKLACETGGRVAVPSPSYPLFGHLVGLEAARTVSYRLTHEGHWQLDPLSLQRIDEPTPDLLFAVNPNNPTGHSLSQTDLERLVRRARDWDALLVVDEVFLDYHFEKSRFASALEHAEPPERPPMVVLSGLSKVTAAPGAKMSWIALAGPRTFRERARRRLAYLADNYLSVSTPTQRAAPRLLRSADSFQSDLRRRLARNAETASQLVDDAPPCSLPRTAGGWYQPVRLPGLIDERELTLDLLRQGVSIEPGFLYEFATGSHVVASLLPEPDRFEEALDRTLRAVQRRLSDE